MEEIIRNKDFTGESSALRLTMHLVMKIYAMRCRVIRELMDEDGCLSETNIENELQIKMRMN